MKYCNWIFLFVIVYSLPLYGQQHDLKLALFVGSTFPLGNYSQKIGEVPRITRRFGFDYGKEAGLASAGIGVGAETSQALTDNLSWIIGARIFVNKVDNSEITSFFQNELGDSIAVSIENGTWVNLPIFTGFSYYQPLLPDLRMYALLQGGLNITHQPFRRAIVKERIVEETKFRTTPDFGFEVGLGLEFKNRFNFGIRYLNLGRPRYEGERKLNESFFTTIPKRVFNVDGDERPIVMLVVGFGYKL